MPYSENYLMIIALTFLLAACIFKISTSDSWLYLIISLIIARINLYFFNMIVSEKWNHYGLCFTSLISVLKWILWQVDKLKKSTIQPKFQINWFLLGLQRIAEMFFFRNGWLLGHWKEQLVNSMLDLTKTKSDLWTTPYLDKGSELMPTGSFGAGEIRMRHNPG